MATLTEAQYAQAATATAAFKAQQNREAARLAALVALYYRQKVDVEDAESVQRWLDLMIPRIIKTSDDGAKRAVTYFNTLRRLEVPDADRFTAVPSLGVIDAGVAKSLMAVGPGAYLNKAREIRGLDLSPAATKAALIEAKQVTEGRLAQAAVRHAQAGGRQTVFDNAARDDVALGWVRVTRAKPCFFCAALASRGLQYRTYKEGSFDMSDARFTGDGNAKVHDKCGCSLKPVWTNNDPLVDKTKDFADLWARWGAGGGDAMLRFRRGYNHWLETGEYLTWEQANEGLRAA